MKAVRKKKKLKNNRSTSANKTEDNGYTCAGNAISSGVVGVRGSPS